MLVECVPNFSCGDDGARALAAVVESTPGVTLLGGEADADHHRAVLTLAGDGERVLEGARRLVAEAVRRFDLRAHEGVHPRTGVADVVPFVPLGETTMELCAELAARLAEWAGRELRLPAYLYEQAARVPERRNLAELRRALRTTGAGRPAPDFGPAEPHETGGVLITGARTFLIAANVDLRSDDIKAARRIARRVRESSGGLPAVKAKGFRLASRGRVQVSMNLVDFRRTGLSEAFAAVEAAAGEEGIEVASTELIGLLPAEAARKAVERSQKLRTPLAGRVIEEVLAERRPHHGLQRTLDAIAGTTPAPGGGTSAGLTLGLSAATLLKALRFSMAGQGDAALTSLDAVDAFAVVEELLELRLRALELAEDDRRGFAAYMEALALRGSELNPDDPKAGKAARKARVADTRAAVLATSTAMIEIAERLAELGEALVDEGSRHLINDSALGVELAVAAGRGAIWNELANRPKKSVAADLAARLDTLRAIQQRVEEALASRYRAKLGRG